MKYASPDLLLSTENLSLQPVYVGKHFLVTVAMYVLEESQSIKSKPVLANPVSQRLPCTHSRTKRYKAPRELQCHFLELSSGRGPIICLRAPPIPRPGPTLFWLSPPIYPY